MVPVSKTKFIMFQFLEKSVCIYIACVILHYAVPHAYTYFCVAPTFQGFVLSAFMAPAPHCQIMRWTIYHTGNTINIMWLCIGTWIVEKLLVTRGKNDTKKKQD